MELVRFKVTNFRSVVDSGWIEIDRVTALIGVNESGKTNLLLPLWKLNPAREGEIKATSDYPKATFNEIQEDPGSFAFVTAEFKVPDLASKLAELTGLPESALQVVQVRRFFDGKYRINFPEHAPKRAIDATAATTLFQTAVSELQPIPALSKEGTLKDEFLAAIESVVKSLSADSNLDAAALRRIASKLKAVIPESPAPTSSIVPRYNGLLAEIEAEAKRLELPDPGSVDGVLELVTKSLPRFVYYSNYGNLDSEIYLPHVVENMKRENLGAREAAKARTLRVLFSFVRLEPDQILELGRDIQNDEKGSEARIAEVAENKRRRTIMLNSAGTDLTKKFKNWWKQGDYTFEFQADGNHFRIWVSDSRRPEKVELEDRSTGLQWFLSFYLVFLVESEQDHQNAFLLLDEPGLSLHPLAQRDLSAFFENLANTNQILYTTHSPFLVDADMLDRARKVYVSEDGSTKASADLRRGSEDPRKSGATYAIHSALNMNVAESLLLGCHPVIVEGPSDQHYLATIKTLLIAAGRISPKREIVFPPSHGAKNAKVVASILTGRDEVLPIMLLDGDDAGRKVAMDMKNGLYRDAKQRILSTDDFSLVQNSEIEDLFPATFLADVVDRWERRSDIGFSDVVDAQKPIVPQIESWATSQGIVLPEGWKVDVSREAKKRALTQGVGKFDDEVLNRWTKLFSAFEAN